MSTVKLYKGSKATANAFSYNCASFDFEDTVIDQDYYLISNETSTFPATGETLKQIRLRITAAGINHLTGFDESPTSNQNLVLPPIYTEGTGEETIPYDMPDVKTIPLGAKPDDWELHYMTKYFTRAISTRGYTYYVYNSAGEWDNGQYKPIWRQNVQYYEVPNFAQIFYTDATGFFGVSRDVSVISATEIQENIRVLYNRRPLASNSYFPDEFWWKSGGAFGQILFYQNSLNYSKVVINTASNQTNIIKDYQSRMLVQMIRLSYEDDTYTGIVVIKISADGIPQEAEITALTAPFWRGETIPAKGGAYSVSAGGNGSFQGTSNNRGDINGAGIVDRISNWNTSSELLSLNQNRYRITNFQVIKEVINTLWSPTIWQSFANNFFNPRDAIASCLLIPQRLGPTANGNYSVVVGAERNLSQSTTSLFTETYTYCPVGSLEITDPHWYDGFPDFDNTAIYIHLPYIGVKQLDIEAIMEGFLRVDYVSDVLSGDVVATVWTQDRFGNCNYRYEFKGNCAKVYPLSARDSTMWQSVGSAALKVAGNVGLAVATGGMSAVLGNFSDFHAAAGGSLLQDIGDFASWGASTVADGAGGMAAKAALNSTNQLINSVSAAGAGTGTLASNGAAGGISVPIDTQCYLIIARPKWSNPEHYGEQFGYPSDIGGTINDTPFEGFLSCRTIVLNGISATDVERSEIASYMASGVFV